MRSVIAIVGVGSNLGGRWSILRCARAVLQGRGVGVEAVSPIYTTPALVTADDPPGPDFLNAAWRVRWAGHAEGLLRRLLEVEALFGRTRERRWAARTLDLDLLWAARPIRRPGLEVPHPELTRRAFALAPLLDVAPELAPTYARHLRRRPRRGGRPTPLESRLAHTHQGAPAPVVRRLRVRREALAGPLDAVVAGAGLEVGATAVLSEGREVELLVAGVPRRRGDASRKRRKS